MAAKNWMCTFEAHVKLQSGLETVQTIVTADAIHDAWRVAIRRFLKNADRDNGVLMGVVLTDSIVTWKPLLPATDVAN